MSTSIDLKFAVAIACLLLPMTMAPLSAQEPATESVVSPAGSQPTFQEAQAFLGFWLLNLDLGGRKLQVGIEIVEARDGSEGVKVEAVTQFGTLPANSVTMLDDVLKLAFDSPGGVLVVSATMDGYEMAGTFGNDTGAFSADFRAERSSRGEFQRLLGADGESRIEVGDQLVRLRTIDPPSFERDYAQLETLGAGQVVRFVDHYAIKLTTEVPLRFGSLEVPTENVAANYAGVYSLWLKRTTDGWNLVFNNKADVWGTRHQPGADLGEVALELGESDPPTKTLVAALQERDGGGILSISWGDHRWSAPFEIVTTP